LAEPVESFQISRALADLQGCDAGILATSTLHLVWDLFSLLTREPITIFMDAGAYAVTRWGVQRAAMRGAKVCVFPHRDTGALERAVASAAQGRAPVIVTDGFCPKCGRVAPLKDLLSLARRRRGMLVADDTQALGILGEAPNAQMRYGRGGGGSLRWSGLHAPEALVFCSLAKGFGVPIAVLAGNRPWVRKFEESSLTRMHCSPPSTAALRATEHALECNRRDGSARRGRLLALVQRFRRGLSAVGVSMGHWLFPVQTIQPSPGISAPTLHRRLAESGVKAVLHRDENGSPRVSFIVTAAHTVTEIDDAVSTINAVLPNLETSKEVKCEELVYQ
jgi:8-amino-7-oxononanoate synthase